MCRWKYLCGQGSEGEAFQNVSFRPRHRQGSSIRGFRVHPELLQFDGCPACLLDFPLAAALSIILLVSVLAMVIAFNALGRSSRGFIHG